MESSQSEHEIAARNSYHFAIRKDALQNIEGDTILLVAECGREYDSVCDVEVRIARRETLAVEVDRLRHWQRHNAKIIARAEPGEVLFERLIICIAFVRLDGSD